MSGRYLLDTNIIIALFSRQASVLNGLSQAKEIFVPSVALGELYYGAQKSGRPQQNLARLASFAAERTILNCDENTSAQYGEIKNKLRLKGRPLPENDVWIASLAIQYHLTLATRDAHFKQVDNLRTELWEQAIKFS